MRCADVDLQRIAYVFSARAEPRNFAGAVRAEVTKRSYVLQLDQTPRGASISRIALSASELPGFNTSSQRGVRPKIPKARERSRNERKPASFAACQ
jgi:hypothetical protein